MQPILQEKTKGRWDRSSTENLAILAVKPMLREVQPGDGSNDLEWDPDYITDEQMEKQTLLSKNLSTEEQEADR